MKATELDTPPSRASAISRRLLLLVAALLGCTENASSASPEAGSPLGGMTPAVDTEVSGAMADSRRDPSQVVSTDEEAGTQVDTDDDPTGPSSAAGDDPAMGEDDDNAPDLLPDDDEPQPPADSSSGGPQGGLGQQDPSRSGADACNHINIGNANAILGSGVIAAQVVSVGAASKLRIEGAFRAEFAVDPQHAGDAALTIRADDNILPFVVAEVREDALVVGMKEGAYCLTELSVEGTLFPVSEVSAVNGSRVKIRGLQGQTMAVSAENASEIDAGGQAQRWDLRFGNASKGALSIGRATAVDLELENASVVSLAGSVVEAALMASTASEILATAPGFETRTAQVDVNGISSARLCVSDAVTGKVQELSTLHVACNGKIDIDGPAMRE